MQLNVPALQKLLSGVRRAVDDYGMIHEGDRIAVGVSGGKDSLTLLAALVSLQRFYPLKYDIVPISLKMGFPEEDTEAVTGFCKALGLQPILVPTDIYEVVFETRNEKSPCSLCANLRRGILCSTAKSLGCDVLALGHHFDDAVETMIMNLFVEGRFGCFSPVTELSRMQVKVIRPLLYVQESEIKRFVRAAELDIVLKRCPADGNTKREEAKRFLAELEKKDPGIKKRLFGALERAGADGFSVHPRGRKKYLKEEDA